MDMIVRSAGGQEVSVFAFDDPAHLVVEALAHVGGDPGLSILGGEDNVVIETCVRMGHWSPFLLRSRHNNSSVPTGLGVFLLPFPANKLAGYFPLPLRDSFPPVLSLNLSPECGP